MEEKKDNEFIYTNENAIEVMEPKTEPCFNKEFRADY